MLLKYLFPAGLALFVSANPMKAQDCSIPFAPSQFKARLAWQSAQDGPATLATPVVANLNPQSDSMPEIIIAEATTGISNKIQFYRGDGSNFDNPMILTVPTGFDNYPVPGPTIGDVDGDGIPELIMACYDSKIRVFHNYTENPTAPMTLWITSVDQLDFEDQRPLLADFDADGIPEIYAGSDIFKFNFSNPAAPTLTKVLNGFANKGRSFYSAYGEGSCNPTAVDILSVADCNGDPDCGGLELVAGPIIYSIDVTWADGDGYEIEVQRDLNQLVPPPGGYSDGYTAVADVNLDGILDVVVTSKRANNQMGVYVWNKNGLIRFFSGPVNSPQSGSLACIANVYDDTKAGYAQDFPEILICSSYNFTCFNLHAAASTPAAPYWWNLPTTDYSGWTGSTVYDFNGDGLSEIVYRDERDFRILYGGAAPFPPGVDAERNWHKIPCWSPTADEYAVVADVDNDGETEIVVTGRLQSSVVFLNSKGRLRVFKSDAGPWVPCRNVWNQYNYFVVNVNDDLSIPAQQQTHHLELPVTGSGDRPLNRYLSQRPNWGPDYEIVVPLPDATVLVSQVGCQVDSIPIKLNICNTGDQLLHAGIPVTFYQSDPTATNALQLGEVQHTNTTVPKDSCRQFTFTVPKIAGTTYGVVNDDGTRPRPFQLTTAFPLNDELECNWLNNIFQFDSPNAALPPNLGPDLGACTDTLVVLNAGAGYLSYLWQDGSTGSVFTAQQPGQYWVEATDICAHKYRDSLEVILFDQPAVQLDTINGDCFGQLASVTVAPVSNNLPVHYLWSTGDTISTLNGLSDGFYSLTVTNAKGCTSTSSTWVEAGGNLQVTAWVAATIPCYGQTGDVQLNITTGKAPYTFEWSDGSDAPTLNNVPAGNYAVTVTDADHCVQTLQIPLIQPNALVSDGVTTLPACPGLSNGEAAYLGAAQGTPPYTLLWSTSATTPNLTGLEAGTYQLMVTDANGCTLVESAQVPLFLAPVTNATVSDLSCFGANDGSVQVDVLSGDPGFGFSWSNNATVPVIDQLPPGDYTLTLTYANGKCAQAFDFQIHEPLPILASAVSSPAICNGGSGGSIDLTVQNGNAPLHFLWSNSAVTEDPFNLMADTYQVTIADANGCTATYSQAVAELPGIAINTSTQMPQCAGGVDGAIQLVPGGGTAPFQINWSNSSTGTSINGIAAGIYTATVTDAAACTEIMTILLDEPAPLISMGTTSSPACPDLANGAISFSGASQGTPPYQLLWSNNATTTDLTGLAAGDYQLTITDANHCTLVEQVQVPAFLAPVTNDLVTDATCFGSNDGSIAVNVLNGSPGFGFLWSNNAITPHIANLTPGQYTLTLTYADGLCSQMAVYQIQEPPPISILNTMVTPVRCFGESNGAIELSAIGGTPPYQYNWASGQQTLNIDDLAAGHYTLSLTDSHGCLLAPAFDILQPAPLAVGSVVKADTCHSGDGAITVNSTGGVPPYQFNWSNGISGPNLAGLASGQYDLTLTDANGCTLVQLVPVLAYGEVPVLLTQTDTITCAHPVAIIGISANQSNLNYQWVAPGGALADQAEQTVLVSGQYQVTVSNAFGCQATAQMQVLEDTASPVAEAGQTAIDVPCTETTVLLDAAGSSHGSNFLNRWIQLVDGVAILDTNAIIIPIHEPGLYKHTVLNKTNGCVAEDSILVDWDLPIQATLAVDTIRCFGDDNGVIRIGNLSGGTPPFHYSIDNQHFSTQNVFTGLLPGDYPVRVRDDHGCWWESAVTLSEPDDLGVILTASDTAIALGQYVHIAAAPIPAGTALNDIVWGPGDLEFEPQSLRQSIRPETPTAFTVQITDKNGCIAKDSIWVAVYNYHIYIPNVIYPESSQNGFFTIFAGDGVLEVRLLRVFDRWGDMMFERRGFPPNELSMGWDGTFRGQPLNPGVFAWYAEVLVRDGRVLFFKGDVTVVR